MRCVWALLLAVVLIGTSRPAVAAEEAEVDHLALATLLLRDGHVARAALALEQADPEAEGFDLLRYHTLRGVVGLRQEDYTTALKAFDAAVEAAGRAGERPDEGLHLYRARCAYALKRCEVVLGALAAASVEARQSDGDLLVMTAECQWEEGRHAQALAALELGAERFPERRRAFTRSAIYRLLELGLYQAAVEKGEAALSRGEVTLDDHLFMSEALIQSGRHAEAARFLEAARLRFGDAPEILVQSGHAWLGADHPLTAARMFQDAARFEPEYAKDAAEIYRQEGLHPQALAMNGRVLDQRVKLKQRLAVLLDMERFEAVVSLAPRLSRLGMLERDEELRYALAYARFRLGDYAKAEGHLRRLTTPALFKRAAQLRKAMADCRQRGALCD